MKGSKIENDINNTVNGSEFQTSLGNSTNGDVNGLQAAIEDSIQDIERKLKVIEQHIADPRSEGENFQPAGVLPSDRNVHEQVQMHSAGGGNQNLYRDGTSFDIQLQSSQAPSMVQMHCNLLSLTSMSQIQGKRNQNEEESEEHQSGMFQFTVRSKMFEWSLLNFFKSTTSTQCKRAVALAACLLTMIGLVVSLAFLTKEFIHSRKQMASTIRYEKSNIIELPTLRFCATGTQLPSFCNLPNKTFHGHPLIWINTVKGTTSNLDYLHPGTKSLPNLHVGLHSLTSRSCTPIEQMDPVLFHEENIEPPKCFHCFSIERAGLYYFKEPTKQNHDATQNRLIIRISQHTFVSNCRNVQLGLSGTVFKLIRSEIVRHHAKLKARGILDTGSYNPDIRDNNYILWPRYRYGYRNMTKDFFMYDIADMFCNVYMFSGYFYPSSSSGIKYKFNEQRLIWERTGPGPYYPEDYDMYFNKKPAATPPSRRGIGRENSGNKGFYPGQQIFVITNTSENRSNKVLGVVSKGMLASLRLERTVERKNEFFRSNTMVEVVRRGDTRSIFDYYVIDIGMHTFLTKVVEGHESVPWLAFLADVFGLASLFLDISVYTLIISPLIVRARQRNSRRKRRNSEP